MSSSSCTFFVAMYLLYASSTHTSQVKLRSISMGGEEAVTSGNSLKRITVDISSLPVFLRMPGNAGQNGVPTKLVGASAPKSSFLTGTLAGSLLRDMRTRPAGIGNVNADWMGLLPSKLSAMPLKYLAVPGSHDSFTFWVDVHAPVGPDQKTYVKYLVTMFSVLAKKFMVKWSMTQNLTFREQLDAGIRYFDLRVSSKPGEAGNEIYFIHGLFGHKVRDGLLEINSFLCRHKKEVVFLDFNHYYAMDSEHHVYLIEMLQEVFGSKLCSDCAVENITLNYLWEKKYQVIVFYHHPSAQGIPVMWPGNKIPAPWANTTEPNKLIQFLETTLKERKKQGSFHVTQAILTPTVNTVAKGLVWGLRDYLVERNLPIIMSWVQTQRPGVDGVNIITSDFVELTDFANIVIKLNNLLLSESEHKAR